MSDLLDEFLDQPRRRGGVPCWYERMDLSDEQREKLVAAFAPANLVTIVATVATMVATGFFVGRWVKLYPIEAAIVNSCRCGQGGTGDVAILTASNRMQLMPFAQIATRIGGLITVSLALFAVARFGA